MKWISKIVAAVFMVGVFLLNFGVSEAATKTVAVMGIENSVSTHFGRLAAQELEAEITNLLVQSGLYNVVERNQLDSVLRELKIHSSGLISGQTAIQFGEMTGADYTVIGNVVSANVEPFSKIVYDGWRANIKLNLKIIDNRTGIIKFSQLIEGDKSISEFEVKPPHGPDPEALLSRAASETAKIIIHKIKEANPAIGRVVKVVDDTVYLNIGKNEGVQKKDSFVLYVEGDAVTEPVTGEILTVEQKRVATVIIVESNEKYSVGKLKKVDAKSLLGTSCKAKRGK